jgi:hypothetical protein
MPFDAAAPVPALAALPEELHGVPRALLVRHALDRIAPALRAAVAAIELEEASPMVNMGLNLDRVAWRAVWRVPGLPDATGSIPVWHGEIV